MSIHFMARLLQLPEDESRSSRHARTCSGFPNSTAPTLPRGQGQDSSKVKEEPGGDSGLRDHPNS
jgi:hypothetical protein